MIPFRDFIALSWAQISTSWRTDATIDSATGAWSDGEKSGASVASFFAHVLGVDAVTADGLIQLLADNPTASIARNIHTGPNAKALPVGFED